MMSEKERLVYKEIAKKLGDICDIWGSYKEKKYDSLIPIVSLGSPVVDINSSDPTSTFVKDWYSSVPFCLAFVTEEDSSLLQSLVIDYLEEKHSGGLDRTNS